MRRVPAALFAGWLALWVWLAIDPVYRADWLLENLLVFVAVPALVLTRRRMRFSNAAYACLAAFFALHAVGAHYTYSLVPYDAWFERLTGHGLDAALGWSRNHYDRFVHFAYGALLLLPAAQLLDRIAPPRGAWRFFLPVLFIASHSVVYELIEFGAAIVFGGDLGQAYLGTQGDEWDSQKDSLLATSGALLAALVLAARRALAARDAPPGFEIWRCTAGQPQAPSVARAVSPLLFVMGEVDYLRLREPLVVLPEQPQRIAVGAGVERDETPRRRGAGSGTPAARTARRRDCPFPPHVCQGAPPKRAIPRSHQGPPALVARR